MFLNFERLPQAAENLSESASALLAAKEKIEYERKRLAANSGTETLTEQMKQTAAALEQKAETLRKTQAALLKISELYQNGEKRISENTECGRAAPKSGFVPGQSLRTPQQFGWTIV